MLTCDPLLKLIAVGTQPDTANFGESATVTPVGKVSVKTPPENPAPLKMEPKSLPLAVLSKV